MAGERVLVIDDSPTIVRVVQLVLTKAGFEVSSAPDGEAGLAAARAQRPDVILLDLNLPRISGHDMLRRLKQDPRFKQVPIIVLTTSGRPDDVRLAYEAGANAYLLKPVEFARFTEIMEQLGRFWLEIVELPPEV